MKKVLMGCAVVSMICGMAFGAALTAERDTYQRLNQYTSLTMASNSIIYAGALVCVNSSGLAVPAADSSGFAVVGRAEATADNRGVLYSATKTIKVARGTFRWANADAIAVADIGKIVYVTDDQTVNKTGGGQNIIAGTVVDVDASGVWVDTAKIGPIGAATPSSLAVGANATVGGTLAVTGTSTLTGATTVTGALAANGGVNCDSGKFTVADTSGNTAVGGTLAVAGAATLNGALTATNAVAFTGLPTATNGLSAGALWNDSGTLKIME
jgi:hypothetical protein